MKKFKVYFFLYLNAVFSETKIIVTGLFGFLLSFYIPLIPYLKTINPFLLPMIILIICFVLAHMYAIIKLIKKNERLIKENIELKKNTSDFTINFELKKITFIEKEKYIQEEIKWAEKELNDIKNINNPQYSGSININYLSSALKLFSVDSSDIQDYLKELKEYEKFLQKLNQYKLFYLLTIIENSGKNYEENLLAKIKPDKGIFIYSYDLELEKLEEVPKRPKSKIERDLASFTHSFTPHMDLSNPVNEMIIRSDKELDVKISKLHIKDTTQIEDKDILLLVKKEIDTIKLNIEIVTKNTKFPIKITKELTI